MTADALVSRHTAVWQAATVHPFHSAARDGSVPEDSFDRWLAQGLPVRAGPGAPPTPASGPRPLSPTSACSQYLVAALINDHDNTARAAIVRSTRVTQSVRTRFISIR